MAEANDKMQKKVNSLNVAVNTEIKKLRKQYSEAEDLIELYDEIDGKHKRATEEISRLLQVINSKDKEIKFLQKRIDQLEIQTNSIANLVERISTATVMSKREIILARRNE